MRFKCARLPKPTPGRASDLQAPRRAKTMMPDLFSHTVSSRNGGRVESQHCRTTENARGHSPKSSVRAISSKNANIQRTKETDWRKWKSWPSSRGRSRPRRRLDLGSPRKAASSKKSQRWRHEPAFPVPSSGLPSNSISQRQTRVKLSKVFSTDCPTSFPCLLFRHRINKNPGHVHLCPLRQMVNL